MAEPMVDLVCGSLIYSVITFLAMVGGGGGAE